MSGTGPRHPAVCHRRESSGSGVTSRGARRCPRQRVSLGVSTRRSLTVFELTVGRLPMSASVVVLFSRRVLYSARTEAVQLAVGVLAGRRASSLLLTTFPLTIRRTAPASTRRPRFLPQPSHRSCPGPVALLPAVSPRLSLSRLTFGKTCYRVSDTAGGWPHSWCRVSTTTGCREGWVLAC